MDEEDSQYYEIVYLADPKLTPEEAAAFAEHIRADFSERGASIDSWDNPRKRSLAYPIAEESEAYIGAVRLVTAPAKIGELKRILSGAKPILRSLVVEWKRSNSSRSKSFFPKPAAKEEQAPHIPPNETLLDQKLEEILGPSVHESQ